METITKKSSIDSEQRTDPDEKTLSELGFYWRERDEVRVLVCRPLEEAGFANGFSTRLGGVSNLETVHSNPPATAEGSDPDTVGGGNELNLAGFNEDSRGNIYENRRRFLSLFRKEYRLATAWQVHGDSIRFVRQHSETGDADERADALISNLDGVLLGVKTADCVPILIGDPSRGCYAAIHAGWRGTAKGILQKSIATLTEEFGSDPNDLLCAIGPAAGCELYEVGEDVISTFSANFARSERYFTETRPGHALVDLKAANKDQLIKSGVDRSNIFIAPYCTMERVDLFFSYRVEKQQYGRTGRLMSVIGKLC
jgi:YfiH family protein